VSKKHEKKTRLALWLDHESLRASLSIGLHFEVPRVRHIKLNIISTIMGTDYTIESQYAMIN